MWQRSDKWRGARHGAGLGLAIVDSIARARGAVITATVNPGGGLIIRADFPDQG